MNACPYCHSRVTDHMMQCKACGGPLGDVPFGQRSVEAPPSYAFWMGEWISQNALASLQFEVLSRVTSTIPFEPVPSRW
jgi:hypothetical protein